MRISGPNSRALLEKLFTGRAEPRRVSYGRIADEDGSTVDTCCAVYFAAPASFTGEDMAEISCHGSLAVAKKLTELIENTGLARRAQPGEFTKRAYLNGKMDLAEAEAVMDMISATAERSRRAAVSQLEGRLSAEITSLYERTKLLAAAVSAYLEDDTGEAELPPDTAPAVRELSAETSALAEGGMRSRILREGARVAIIGSPNVGKSSLLNALLMRERAIVADIPGTTRDTVEESAEVEGIPVVFIDTAGIREAADRVEALGVERSVREAKRADLVLWLCDGTRPTNEEDMAALHRAEGVKTLAVITKIDLPTMLAEDAGGRFCGVPACRISSVTGEGLTLLRRTIAEALLPEAVGEGEATVTNLRHVRALAEAASRLSAAADTADSLPDAALFELRAAMELFASVIGRDDPAEELVDTIFSGFCMGK